MALFKRIEYKKIKTGYVSESELSTPRADAQKYGVSVKPCRYWYDNVSSVWGREGGPSEGQIHAGLGLSGPLRGMQR